MTVFCNYCSQEARLLSGDEVYQGRWDLAKKYFYVCKPCDARVGCHPKTKKPLGSLAKKHLRDLRMQAHKAFDVIWQGTNVKRGHAYHLLAVLFKQTSVHISQMTEEEAKQVPRFAGIIQEVLYQNGGEYGDEVKEEIEAVAEFL